MKKAAFIVLLVPVLFFAGTLNVSLEQIAQADSGSRGGRVGHSGGREGFVGRAGPRVQGGGGVVARHGGRGDFVGYRGGGYVGHGGHRHGGHFSSSIWIGPGWGWGYDPFFYPFYPTYRYPYYSPPSVVVVPQQPEEYISPAPQEEQRGYWYYCKDANGYYPYVERCPGGWMRVVPYEPPPK